MNIPCEYKHKNTLKKIKKCKPNPATYRKGYTS